MIPEVSQIGRTKAKHQVRYKRSQTRLAVRKRRLIAASAIGLALLAGTIVVIVLLATGSPGKYAEVPEVTGLTYDKAKARLASADLDIEIDPTQDIAEVKIGAKEVCYQTPARGSEATKGSTVTVSLSDVPSRGDEKEGAKASAPAAPPEAQPEPEPAPAAQPEPAPAPTPDAGLSAPLEGGPLYPFTSEASVACGQWESGSQDYPYFGASRNGGARKHAGIDIYPPGGNGAPVHAVKDGTVIKIAPFYTRASGEVTYGLLIDHGDFVANYAELRPPSVAVGARVARNQQIGLVSGTVQLHFEQYAPGTTDWTRGWYGDRPGNLLDPTAMMSRLFGM
jgi:murein DD-endopeptidase MepM/ murein hydrolase activator NlpD